MSYELRRSHVEGREVVYLHFPHLEVPHGASSRLGGISQGPYAALNLGRYSGDDLEVVAENRRRFGAALGLTVPPTLQMSHGREVAYVTESSQNHAADACLTDRPGVHMSLTTADCVPILFADPGRGVVALAHAGWRGTVLGIAGATVEAMLARGSRASDIRVGIGAAIGPCCFEVDADVADPFLESQPEVVETAGPKWRVHLVEANRRQLLAAGVCEGAIAVCDLCTSCRSDLFFSYRRDRRVTGRMAVAIGL